MNARSRLTRALAASLTVLVLGAAPVAATESTPATEAGTEESDRLTIPESSHDRFGVILFGLAGLAGAGALVNAAKQLKGTRPQADGRIRWR